jgi:hypothetical protein
MRVLCAILALSALAGCGTWQRPGSTEADLNREMYECEMQAAQAYPPVYSTEPGYTTAARTTCQSYGYQTQCTTTPGVTYPGTTTDMNAIARTTARDSCMRSKGWKFKMQ